MTIYSEDREEVVEVDGILFETEPHDRMALRMLLHGLGMELTAILNATDPEAVRVLDAMLAGEAWEMGTGEPGNGVYLSVRVDGDVTNSLTLRDATDQAPHWADLPTLEA